MTDYEILKFLRDIKPESIKQKRALKKVELTFLRSINTVVEVDEDLEEYLMAYERDELIDMSSGELYREYLEFCENEELTPVTHKKFTQAVKYTFDLDVKVVRQNNKIFRIYKSCI